jgi:hypothetical protein
MVENKTRKPVTGFLEYYRLFWSTFRRSNWAFGRDQIVGLIVAVLIIVLNVRNGLVRSDQRWPYIGGVSLVALCVFGVYLLIKLARTPWKLYVMEKHEHASICGDLSKRIEDLQRQKYELETAIASLKEQLRSPIPKLLL